MPAGWASIESLQRQLASNPRGQGRPAIQHAPHACIALASSQVSLRKLRGQRETHRASQLPSVRDVIVQQTRHAPVRPAPQPVVRTEEARRDGYIEAPQYPAFRNRMSASQMRNYYRKQPDAPTSLLLSRTVVRRPQSPEVELPQNRVITIDQLEYDVYDRSEVAASRGATRRPRPRSPQFSTAKQQQSVMQAAYEGE